MRFCTAELAGKLVFQVKVVQTVAPKAVVAQIIRAPKVLARALMLVPVMVQVDNFTK